MFDFKREIVKLYGAISEQYALKEDFVTLKARVDELDIDSPEVMHKIEALQQKDVLLQKDVDKNTSSITKINSDLKDMVTADDVEAIIDDRIVSKDNSGIVPQIYAHTPAEEQVNKAFLCYNQTTSGLGWVSVNTAQPTRGGFMSKEDKAKLDEIGTHGLRVNNSNEMTITVSNDTYSLLADVATTNLTTKVYNECKTYTDAAYNQLDERVRYLEGQLALLLG